MKEKKIQYYVDELNDDFTGISRKPKIIDDNYKYVNHNVVWNGLAFIAYRIIMTPIAYFYCKIKLHMKVYNKKILKPYKKQGYYLYGNHTHVPADGYIPTVLAFPKKPYVVVHPDSVALKGTEQFMLMIGAVPLPSTIHGISNFIKALSERFAQNNCIMIYPEAHIWPYYTKIRPFKSVSFKYPVRESAPCFCFTTTYKKRKYSLRPRVEVFVDGPFFSDESLNRKQQQEQLRNTIYEKMVERSANSDYEYITYIKKEV